MLKTDLVIKPYNITQLKQDLQNDPNEKIYEQKKESNVKSCCNCENSYFNPTQGSSCPVKCHIGLNLNEKTYTIKDIGYKCKAYKGKNNE